MRPLLSFPMAGYLIKPVRRGTLLKQLTAHDNQTIEEAVSDLEAAASGDIVFEVFYRRRRHLEQLHRCRHGQLGLDLVALHIDGPTTLTAR